MGDIRPNGAGHFVKRVHNGIEYGLMAANAERLSILRDANVRKEEHAIGHADYQDRLLSAMRYGFGGHLEKAAAK